MKNIKISNSLKRYFKQKYEGENGIQYLKDKLSNYKIVKDCWIWKGSTNKQGYGRLKFKRKIYGPHRLSYELYIGKIKKGLCVCHKCDNPSCINPEHLFLGTLSDNMKDAYKKGRMVIPYTPGEKHTSSILTDKKVIEILKMKKEQKITDKKLGEKFGVNRRTINNIIHNKTWKHISRSSNLIG